MSHTKPFYRNVRGMKPAPHSGYSGRAFIEDPDYAENPAHYTRALLLIINDLKSIFEYVEPSNEASYTFSYRIHALLMRTCIEIEANFRAIFQANEFSLKNHRHLNILDFRRVDVTHHLSSYEVILPIWNGEHPAIRPFSPWFVYRGRSVNNGVPLPWYQAYNASKHNRQQDFKKANLWALIEAVAALLILVSSQFKSETFDAGYSFLSLESKQYESSIGEVFLIKYPEDWTEHEWYDFDWSELRLQPERFSKINYDVIPI